MFEQTINSHWNGESRLWFMKHQQISPLWVSILLNREQSHIRRSKPIATNCNTSIHKVSAQVNSTRGLDWEKWCQGQNHKNQQNLKRFRDVLGNCWACFRSLAKLWTWKNLSPSGGHSESRCPKAAAEAWGTAALCWPASFHSEVASTTPQGWTVDTFGGHNNSEILLVHPQELDHHTKARAFCNDLRFA